MIICNPIGSSFPEKEENIRVAAFYLGISAIFATVLRLRRRRSIPSLTRRRGRDGSCCSTVARQMEGMGVVKKTVPDGWQVIDFVLGRVSSGGDILTS